MLGPSSDEFRPIDCIETSSTIKFSSGTSVRMDCYLKSGTGSSTPAILKVIPQVSITDAETVEFYVAPITIPSTYRLESHITLKVMSVCRKDGYRCSRATTFASFRTSTLADTVIGNYINSATLSATGSFVGDKNVDHTFNIDFTLYGAAFTISNAHHILVRYPTNGDVPVNSADYCDVSASS